MGQKFNNIKKVLFIRLGAIGDVVHTTATYQTLKNQTPDLQIDYLTSPMMVDLLSNDPALQTIYALDRKTYKSIPELYKLAHSLSKNSYDIVVNLQPSFKTFFISDLIKPSHILTYKKHRPFKNERYQHVVENYLATITPLLDKPIIPKKLTLPLKQEAIEWGKATFNDKSIETAIALIPGVSKARLNKLWPEDHWKDLTEYILKNTGYKIIIIGGNDETEIAKKLTNIDQSRIFNFCNKLTIEQTAAILTHCKIAIGSDTGPTHMATALNTKTIGFYGPTSPERVGLYGDKHTILVSDYKCLFCEKKKCNKKHKSDLYAPCMIHLSVENITKLL